MIAALVLGAVLGRLAHADQAVLTAVKDNTLIETPTGSLSNATGNAIYSGRTGQNNGFFKRRALVQFDTSSIPPGSTITSATLTLRLTQVSQTNPAAQTHTLHRLTASWGEGTSLSFVGQGGPATAGDATWLHRFYPDTLWAAPGGDFIATASASTMISGANAFYSWTGATVIADVQGWVDDPDSNFGWMLRGNEVDANTSRKFASRESIDDPNFRPKLTIEFTPPAKSCLGDCAPAGGDGTVGVADLLAVISAWGPAKSGDPCDIAPPTGDGTIGVADLLAVISAWGPCR